MTNTISRVACAALATALLASCESPAPVNRAPRAVAHLVSGDVVPNSSSVLGARATVVELDGKPPAEPYGPFELNPGEHLVALKCDSSTKSYAIAVVAGELYRFAARSVPDVKGCVPALSRVRKTNP